MITFENITHFIAVVEHDGINKAASKLFVSPSSISRSINSIEKELDAQIFDRIGRTIQLNDVGKKFYQKSLRLKLNFDDLHRLEDGDQNLVGNFSIGLAHSLGQSKLVKGILGLPKDHKNSTFEIMSSDSNILPSKIYNGEIDIALLLTEKDPLIVESEIVFEGNLFLCARKDHPLMRANPDDFFDKICDYPAIMHKPYESFERSMIHPLFKTYELKPDIQIYWDSEKFAIEALKQSDSWSLLPDLVIDSDPQISKFNHPKNWTAKYQVRVCWNKKKNIQVLKNALLQNLKSVF